MKSSLRQATPLVGFSTSYDITDCLPVAQRDVAIRRSCDRLTIRKDRTIQRYRLLYVPSFCQLAAAIDDLQDYKPASVPLQGHIDLSTPEDYQREVLRKAHQKVLWALASAQTVVSGIASCLYDVEAAQSDVSARLCSRTSSRIIGKKRKLSPSTYDYGDLLFPGGAGKADTPTQASPTALLEMLWQCFARPRCASWPLRMIMNRHVSSLPSIAWGTSAPRLCQPQHMLSRVYSRLSALRPHCFFPD